MENENKPIKLVKIRGKDYETVASRVERFRRRFPDWTITTDIKEMNTDFVLMKVTVANTEGTVIGTGHSMEYFEKKDACTIENAETSAVGRALGFAIAGFSGDCAVATAEEMQNKMQYQQPSQNHSLLMPPMPAETFTAQLPALPAFDDKNIKTPKTYKNINGSESKFDNALLDQVRTNIDKWLEEDFGYRISGDINGNSYQGQTVKWKKLIEFSSVLTKSGRVSLKEYLHMNSGYEKKGDKFFHYRCVAILEWIRQQDNKKESA